MLINDNHFFCIYSFSLYLEDTSIPWRYTIIFELHCNRIPPVISQYGLMLYWINLDQKSALIDHYLFLRTFFLFLCLNLIMQPPGIGKSGDMMYDIHYIYHIELLIFNWFEFCLFIFFPASSYQPIKIIVQVSLRIDLLLPSISLTYLASVVGVPDYFWSRVSPFFQLSWNSHTPL